MKTPNYSILIICEGENTEPNFFNSIRDEVLKGTYELFDDPVITIRPESKNASEEDEDSLDSPHKSKRIKRPLKKAIKVEPEDIKIPHPLKWIIEGQKALENGSADEVWAVYDHDNHPARKEAVAAADEIVNGKQVKIAFSSNCFEYYLLLHFERINYAFCTSECQVEKSPRSKEPINCSDSNNHPNDCHGKTCIGGYARKNKYWDKSKDTSSMFPLIKDMLEIGYENAAWLRYQSDQNYGNKPKYNRNPYVTVDKLVKRLTGNTLNWEWISLDEVHQIGSFQIIISTNSQFQLKNIGNRTEIIPSDSLCKVSPDLRTKQIFGDRKVIEPYNPNDPNTEYNIDLEEIISDPNEWFIFSYDNYRILFDFVPPVLPEQNALHCIANKLVSLTQKELTSLINLVQQRFQDTSRSH